MCDSEIQLKDSATMPEVKSRESRIILALDELDLKESIALVEKVGGYVYAVKIHNLYDRYGSSAIANLRAAGAELVWVDAKLHDIPNTVAHRAKAISDAGADILTVHASGGSAMIQAAIDAFDGQVYAVTVLTSLNEDAACKIYGRPVQEAVDSLYTIAGEAGAHGVVCSPQEVERLSLRSDYLMPLIVPGIRSAGAEIGDQKRVGTPAATLQAGANKLVIGRQVTKSSDPLESLKQIETEIQDI